MSMDSRLILGQLVDPALVEGVAEMAHAELPEKLADQKLQKLIQSRYKLKGVLKQMEGFIKKEDHKEKLQGLRDEIINVDTKIATAAQQLVEETIAGFKTKKKLRKQQKKKRIGMNIESPIDFGLSGVESFPIAFDGMDFDVQYFRNEENTDNSRSETGGEKKEDKGKSEGSHNFASKVAKFAAEFVSEKVEDASSDPEMISDGLDTTLATRSHVENTVNDSLSHQSSHHQIAGTLVIVARCTHQNADIISPCILDSSKLMTAWNYTFPENQLSTLRQELYDFVFNEENEPPKQGDDALHLLTGCTRGSSFVGMAHTIKTETTKSGQTGTDTAKTIRIIVEKEAMIGARTGQTGRRMENAAKLVQNLMSSAQIFNHCTLITQGIIPNIAASEVVTTVQELSPTPGDLLKGLKAIQDASGDADLEGMQERGKIQEAKKGSQFLQQSNEFAASTVSAVVGKEAVTNQVIDANSLMTAFTDYITKAQAGECGVPIGFMMQKINKYDVAKAYIRSVYPTNPADKV
eukprot:CAMPEP_0194165218 /NCGR_PEP_ID=MMETSP0154-20130528/1206_1 /TAXON_ID=1049557 /ORGANISM="Thalassiothrix antarctica, Strain L6-D1" /LENGTH=520 /DNA_ID=CAMNT_0038875599 /DNA_START=59 /DNA_END=1621 /DNA_ORIENTATION=-